MSKANAPATSAPQDATASPATAATPLPDKHHGTGGLYSIVNGERVRVSHTKPAADATGAAKAKA